MQTLESALNGPLTEILRKAKKLAAINEMLQILLDTNIAPHCQAANLEQNTLIILCDSAAYATNINFQKIALLRALQDHFADIKDIRCKTHPSLL